MSNAFYQQLEEQLALTRAEGQKDCIIKKSAQIVSPQ